MIDQLTPEARSANMQAVRGKDTLPEMRVRRAAHALGLRYRLHVRKLPGSPDLVFPRHRTALFVHGCFWHRHRECRKTTTPKSNTAFWQAKFDRNVARDADYEHRLTAEGWRVLVVWECETADADRLSRILRDHFGKPAPDWPAFGKVDSA